MTRTVAMIAGAAGILAASAHLALAGPYSVHNSYWDQVERQQECTWGGGRAYAWGAAEYPCWNYGPRAAYGTWHGPYAYLYPYPYYGYSPYGPYGWR